MYSRDFAGIKSEGQLYNYEREYNRSRHDVEEHREDPEDKREERECLPESRAQKGIRLDFLRDLRLDDLILIGIGLLLLLDSDGENDIFVLLIAFLLLL